MVSLGGPPGTFVLFSGANDVSADGNVIIGSIATVLDPAGQAFRWTSETGVVRLAETGRSIGHGVSADGSVVVGGRDLGAGFQAFRWTAQTGMVGLGDLPGGRVLSTANDVSANGMVVVGSGETAFDGSLSTTEAFFWTAGTGMVNLRSFLVSQGADLAGWKLISAEGVSADGRTIVGTGENPAGNPEGWIATIPEPSTLLLAALSAAALFAVRLGRIPPKKLRCSLGPMAH
jgi:probable HAF family extracellular repeat protein